MNLVKIVLIKLGKYEPSKNINSISKHQNGQLSKGFMKSSGTCAHLYSKCIIKSSTDITYKSYIKYRNTYNRLKKISKQTYYAQICKDTKHGIRKTWKIINSTIGKLNTKTVSPQTFKTYNSHISDSSILIDNVYDFL